MQNSATLDVNLNLLYLQGFPVFLVGLYKDPFNDDDLMSQTTHSIPLQMHHYQHYYTKAVITTTMLQLQTLQFNSISPANKNKSTE